MKLDGESTRLSRIEKDSVQTVLLCTSVRACLRQTLGCGQAEAALHLTFFILECHYIAGLESRLGAIPEQGNGGILPHAAVDRDQSVGEEDALGESVSVATGTADRPAFEVDVAAVVAEDNAF